LEDLETIEKAIEVEAATLAPIISPRFGKKADCGRKRGGFGMAGDSGSNLSTMYYCLCWQRYLTGEPGD
jgi:hypothetical protein